MGMGFIPKGWDFLIIKFLSFTFFKKALEI